MLTFRHTGASDVAQRGRDAGHVLTVVRKIPDAEVFAADLAPLCEDRELDEGEDSSVAA